MTILSGKCCCCIDQRRGQTLGRSACRRAVGGRSRHEWDVASKRNETELLHGRVKAFRLDRGHPYYDHFRSRKRGWELRLQGKFKKASFSPSELDHEEGAAWQAPRGRLYVGAVLRDFNYAVASNHVGEAMTFMRAHAHTARVATAPNVAL